MAFGIEMKSLSFCKDFALSLQGDKTLAVEGGGKKVGP